MKFELLSLLTLTLLSVAADEPEPISFELLASFDYEEGMALPKKITRLDEKKVTISGFMASEDGRGGEVEYFILINDGCGCEGTPMLNEMVFCALPEGEKMEIQPGTVEITGKLYVGETEEDGVVVTLYTMDVDSVKD